MWVAEIMVDGDMLPLGAYDMEEEAAQAYDVAAMGLAGRLVQQPQQKILQSCIYILFVISKMCMNPRPWSKPCPAR